MLTFHAGCFAQVIEGPEWQLRLLMKRICADRRHHSLKVVTDGPITARRYPDWSMAYRDPHEFLRQELAEVVEEGWLLSEAFQSTRH